MTALESRETISVSSCDHCGCDQSDVALEASPWTLRSCADCGFVFTSPRLSDAALASIYAEEYYENAETYAEQQILSPSDDHRHLAQTARKRLGRRPTGTLTSMDIGCGGGRLVAAFQDAGFNAAGVEPSEATVRAARQAGRDVRVSDISELPDQSYDCVTAIHVLEHVPSPKQFMQHAYRICRPGGLCIIEVPNFASKAARQQGANWYALHPSTHLSHFTPGSLAACLSQAQFQVQSVHRLGGGGVFANVSEATVRKTSGVSDQKRSVRSRLLSAIWKSRSAILSIPSVRRFGRWVNWELLGHGEFVRIVAARAS